MRHVVRFSTGITSWLAARRTVEAHGTDRLKLLFADTLAEDEDNYRFLIDGAADVFGVPLADVADLSADARATPPLESSDLAARKAHLADLRGRTAARLPGLAWIADGRTPFEVFHDERFLGNSRLDPCSKILKRELCDRWHREHCDPAETVCVFGLDWTEPHRVSKLRAMFEANGWRTDFPLTREPLLPKTFILSQAWARGLNTPRLYEYRVKHANCGMLCCKMGQAQAKELLAAFPERYAYGERREESLRAYLGKDVSMLTDRRGGTGKKPLTLRQFRERLQSTGEYDACDAGGCACFVGSLGEETE